MNAEPLPRSVKLPADDTPISAFGHWNYHGRIPPRSVFAWFVGTGGVEGASGYVVAALSCTGQALHTELGIVGEHIPADKLEGYFLRSEVLCDRQSYAIFSPKEFTDGPQTHRA